MFIIIIMSQIAIINIDVIFATSAFTTVDVAVIRRSFCIVHCDDCVGLHGDLHRCAIALHCDYRFIAQWRVVFVAL